MKNIQDELLKSVTQSTIESLAKIERIHVCRYADDASSAVHEGAVLLAISSIDNDDDGDGFRYLIGLRHGTNITPHLSNFFK